MPFDNAFFLVPDKPVPVVLLNGEQVQSALHVVDCAIAETQRFAPHEWPEAHALRARLMRALGIEA